MRRRGLSKRVPGKNAPRPAKRLGVDLVEFKKAKAFYGEHRNRLDTFFDGGEIRLIRQARRPYESLALLLAAKEAVFKSLGEPWMGPEGFRKIRIFSRKNRELSFRLKGNFKKHPMRRPAPALFFLKSKDYVVAGCR